MNGEFNDWGVVHALRLALHHVNDYNLRYLCDVSERGDASVVRAAATDRFDKVRSKVVPALDQMRMIKRLAEEMGYSDILELFDQALPLEAIPREDPIRLSR